MEPAMNLYNQAQKLDSDVEIDTSNLGYLYFFCSLNNQAQDIIFACEKAVKLEPNNKKNSVLLRFSKSINRRLFGRN